VLPFAVRLRSGFPVDEQVFRAVAKALAGGQLAPGDRFPSIRTLSQELRINPNTARKAVAALVQGGLLEVDPGVGTVVARSSGEQRRHLLDREVARVVVEAQALGLTLEHVVDALRDHWNRARGPRA
jgi:GntR family transcriptional regulator